VVGDCANIADVERPDYSHTHTHMLSHILTHTHMRTHVPGSDAACMPSSIPQARWSPQQYSCPLESIAAQLAGPAVMNVQVTPFWEKKAVSVGVARFVLLLLPLTQCMEFTHPPHVYTFPVRVSAMLCLSPHAMAATSLRLTEGVIVLMLDHVLLPSCAVCECVCACVCERVRIGMQNSSC
jgi:hypothetical protein